MTNPATIFLHAKQAATQATLDEVNRQPEDMNAFDCGFAWVTIHPARGSFVSWCKAQIKALGGERNYASRQYGDKAYGGGWQFWKPGEFNGQSIRIHEVGARAFRDELAKYGISATVGSRLD